MRKMDLHWMDNPDWYYYDGLVPKVKDNAPQEAKESFERYKQQAKEAAHTD